MSLKLECHLNFNFTQIRMSLKLECHSNFNVIQIEMQPKLNVTWIKMSLIWNVPEILMWLKLECQSNCNVTQIGTSLKLQCQPNWNVTKIGMSLKLKCHSNWKTKYIEKVINPKTISSASIGWILILFCYLCCYSHRSRDALSPVCGIFLWRMKILIHYWPQNLMNICQQIS